MPLIVILTLLVIPWLYQESPFLNQVRRIIRLKHMSRRTEKSYC